MPSNTYSCSSSGFSQDFHWIGDTWDFKSKYIHMLDPEKHESQSVQKRMHWASFAAVEKSRAGHSKHSHSLAGCEKWHVSLNWEVCTLFNDILHQSPGLKFNVHFSRSYVCVHSTRMHPHTDWCLITGSFKWWFLYLSSLLPKALGPF